ncbi:hypothetical protein HHI36_023725 [Cryptolaemus montrouzieri]|uniref:Uncharacterized protein n=1 Tax=Cryptolaemus montrouzieri TaxID=559131 RepID=A0ABD2PHY2_9CUCU
MYTIILNSTFRNYKLETSCFNEINYIKSMNKTTNKHSNHMTTTIFIYTAECTSGKDISSHNDVPVVSSNKANRTFYCTIINELNKNPMVHLELLLKYIIALIFTKIKSFS